MARKEDKYNVTIGIGITEAETPAYADFGLRYSNLGYEKMVEIEAICAKHAPDVIAALAPVLEDLVKMGYAKASELGLNPPKV